MNILIYNTQKDLPILKRKVKKIVQEILNYEKQSCDEVSIHFVSTKKICQLHDEYFQDPTTTDCISFPIDDLPIEEIEYRILGEIFVCPETAINYSQKRGKDSFEELTLYIVHGLLHLLGFDDIDPKDRAKMRKKEKEHLSNLKQKNLIL